MVPVGALLEARTRLQIESRFKNRSYGPIWPGQPRRTRNYEWSLHPPGSENHFHMARSSRKQAAARFRRAIARSNAMHSQYLDDPVLYASYDRFTRWQLDYMLPFFSDLLEPEGYAEAVDFIVSDLAGVGVSERDRDIERAAPVIVRSLPSHPLQTAAAAVELNARALEINLGICRQLLDGGELPTDIAEEDYLLACRAVSSLDECVELVYLAADLGETLKKLVKVPLIGGLLRTMRAPAHAAGFGALQEFLETGYLTFRRISDIDRFLDLLRVRMSEVFEHIYQSPISGG